jgi:hypothetical protein
MVNQTIGRRALLKGAGVVALAASGAVPLREARAQHQVRYSSGTEAAKLKAPVNACDCHMHIYDGRFPVAANATLRPPDASVEDYRMLQQRTGTTRNVVVTPSTYGTDNSCTLDAMAKLGAVSRGVAVVDTSVSDDELKRLSGLGIRGIRFNLVQSGATTIDMLEPLSKRVNALGWHVQIHMLGDQIVQIADLLQRLPSPIVFDHMGRISKEVGPEHPAFRVIAGLVEKRPRLGQALGRLHGHQDRSAELCGFDEARAGVCQGGARPHDMGQRLAASDREAGEQARRRHPLRSLGRVASGRRHPPTRPGRQSGGPLRLPEGLSDETKPSPACGRGNDSSIEGLVNRFLDAREGSQAQY